MVRVQEWDYLDGIHFIENASYLVVERGAHQLADGSWLEAGTLTMGASDTAFVDVSLSAAFFDVPVVIAGVSSFAEADAVTTRLHNIDQKGFQIRLQEQESFAPQHAPEEIAFIAWEPSAGTIDGKQFEVGYTGDEVTHVAHKIDYDSTFAAPPVFLADMQTTDGGDPANLRWQNKGTKSVSVWVDEEQSKDSEVAHTSEIVGYLLFDNGSTD
jgi:hypothetical protein